MRNYHESMISDAIMHTYVAYVHGTIYKTHYFWAAKGGPYIVFTFTGSKRNVRNDVNIYIYIYIYICICIYIYIYIYIYVKNMADF